jgi:protein involved in polysaccharide export with SLBB domain
VFTAVTEGSVTIQGQVRSPGKFKIERGEHLSELLLRAGGLTDQAYPYGTVFLRKSAATIEEQGYQRAADDMESMIVAGLTRIGSEKTSPDTFTALQSFVREVRNTKPLGRISITADPAVLAANPARDPLLEPGDVVYIPQRPSTVTVLGQVMQPGTFQFSSKTTASDYIELAGGYGQYADESLKFLVLPDGTARPLESSWLNLDSPVIPPGSTIVVPRDVSPYDARQILLDVTSLLSSLAISAASLAVISNN